MNMNRGMNKSYVHICAVVLGLEMMERIEQGQLSALHPIFKSLCCFVPLLISVVRLVSDAPVWHSEAN